MEAKKALSNSSLKLDRALVNGVPFVKTHHHDFAFLARLEMCVVVKVEPSSNKPCIGLLFNFVRLLNATPSTAPCCAPACDAPSRWASTTPFVVHS